MTKLKLNLAHQAGEILSREELKKIVGGTEGSGSGSGSGCTYTLECNLITGIKDGSKVECTSSAGNCDWLRNIMGIKVGVKCDGKSFSCIS